jgi:hypothetical protein
MTRFDLIASGLKSLAHNPDHPDAMFPPVPWSNLEFRMIADWDVDDSFVMMSRETYEKFLHHRHAVVLLGFPQGCCVGLRVALGRKTGGFFMDTVST